MFDIIIIAKRVKLRTELGPSIGSYFFGESENVDNIFYYISTASV